MIKLSVVQMTGDSKIAYKGYRGGQLKTMDRLAELSSSYSFSSYIYGQGETDKGEKCEGHRAGRSIVGAGSVLLFDFDNKGATFEDLCDALGGVSAWVGPSKSWSPTVDKYHVVVELDRELPLEAEKFEHIYKAVVQWFGWGAVYDPAMQTRTQQMAPHFGSTGPQRVIAGAALCVDDVLAAYVESGGEEIGSVGGDGIWGEVPDDAVFTLSSTGEKMTVAEILALGESKIRVHCLAGFEHDGRQDTALVRGNLYHCVGGRCKQTLILRDPKPFDEDDEDFEVVLMDNPKSLSEASARVSEVIMQNAHHMAAYNPKSALNLREQAAAYGAVAILREFGVVYFEGGMVMFNGVVWEKPFADRNELNCFIQDVYRGAGFGAMAHNYNSVKNVRRLVEETLPVVHLEVRENVLNLKNCVLRIAKDGFEILPHDPKYMFTSVLPFAYDPKAKCPTWELVVDRIMLHSSALKMSLQDALGYLVLRDLNLELAVMMVGGGENGKSTVQRVIKTLLGAPNVSSQPLHVLTSRGSEGAYARAAMAGKMVNFTNELSPRAMESEAFKNLISGDGVQARRIYGDPFELALVPKQIVAMNSTEGLIKENTHGFIRRLHMVPFNYRIQESDKDPHFWEKLESELAGILNWVLVGAARVAASRKLIKAEEMTSLLEEVARDANPVQQFVEERLEKYAESPDDLDIVKLKDRLTSLSEVFDEFKRFAEDNQYRPIGRNKFAQELRKFDIPKVDTAGRLDHQLVRLFGMYVQVLDVEAAEKQRGRVKTSLNKF